jgi:ribosome-binding protein aMBF1 (putative translation factor)
VKIPKNKLSVPTVNIIRELKLAEKESLETSIVKQILNLNISKDELSTSIGKIIRDLRLANKKSIETLSNEIEIGYSQLSRIERGKINTSVYQLYKILSVLNVPMNTFLEILVLTIKKEKRKKRLK